MPFQSTASAPGVDGVVGQARAVEALRFGAGIRRHGYNLFAVGPQGVGKKTLLEQFLAREAAKQPTPPDWCYVHDFSAPGRPRLLELPAGKAAQLERQMTLAVAELQVSMRSAFESEEYRTRKRQLIARFKERQEAALAEVQQRARQREVAVLETDTGLVLAPLHDGAPVDPDKFQTLAADQQERLRGELERVGQELHELLRKFHDWGRENLEAVRALDRETSAAVARRALDPLRSDFATLPHVVSWLAQVELDLADSADAFLEDSAEGADAAMRRAMGREKSPFRRYRVNVLVDHAGQRGAPVVHEDHPTHPNLLGRVEHESQFGTLVTDFTLIKAGALHRAAGGYLILDALRVLQSPLAWDALKRAMRSGEVRIEALGEALGLLTTVSIAPEPLPLGNLKVVLTGERQLYGLLSALDPDFSELFKVLVDFEDELGRSTASHGVYANLVATLVKKEGLRPFDRGAVARVIDQAARLAGDQEKLTMHVRALVDLLREADFHAADRGRPTATADDVQGAIDARLQRGGRVRQRLQEAIARDDLLIATDGERVGQVNGLSVFPQGDSWLGHPTRITARVRVGKGEVVDIEREVELGGPIHSKGVLIVGGLLGARYGCTTPLAFSGTLVFEQSYGAVEGDSASLAELCALLSALAELPLKQSLALTGSVNQHGQVQSIGGVNEKVEGFFDTCLQRGLTGEQGVLVPETNVKNLMLRRDVVEAVAAGRFHLYAVRELDEALTLLTGRPAGERDAHGQFPEGSVNAAVEARLKAFAECARRFAAKH